MITDCCLLGNYREIAQLSAKSDNYENLLREISQLVDGRMSEQIKQTLDKVCVARLALRGLAC